MKQKKIVCLVRGGLGNQCFMYAAARSLADETDSRLELDLGEFAADVVYKRAYELVSLNVRVDQLVAGAAPLVQLFRSVRYRLLSKSVEHVGNYWCEKRPFKFQTFPAHNGNTVCLDGYWQSERYFSAHAKQIAADLIFKDSQRFENDRMAQVIRNTKTPVFLHIRSYREVPGKSDGSASLPLSYYENALSVMRGLVGFNFKVFVFSDDPTWARSRLQSALKGDVEYVEPLQNRECNNAHRDFYLMRLCQHGIVANSSFSWWAGWLGEQDWLAKGATAIRLRMAKRCMNDDYWPDRWLAVP